MKLKGTTIYPKGFIYVAGLNGICRFDMFQYYLQIPQSSNVIPAHVEVFGMLMILSIIGMRTDFCLKKYCVPC